MAIVTGIEATRTRVIVYADGSELARLPKAHFDKCPLREGEAFEPEERFENPDGSSIVFSSDAFGQDAGLAPLPGPLADGGELQNFGWTEPLAEKR